MQSFDVLVLNASIADADGLWLGCEGVILMAEEYAEIHWIGSGFSDHGAAHYNIISKIVVSTCDIDEIRSIVKCASAIGGSLRTTEIHIDYLDKWTGIRTAVGNSLDLFDEMGSKRTFQLPDGTSVMFAATGSRIRLTRSDSAGRALRIAHELI